MTGAAVVTTSDGRPSTLSVLAQWGWGMAGAVVGLLPWLVSGARLPLQNLWAVETLPADMPPALLPVSQYHVGTIAALLIVGGSVSGVAARALAHRGSPARPTAVGLATAHALSIGQSFGVLHDGLDLGGAPDPRASLYLAGMLGGTVVAALLAQGAFWLVSRRSVVGTATGLMLSAVPLASWTGVWFATVGGPAGPAPAAVELVRWLPALVVAAALGWCGVTPPRRLVAWVTGAAVLSLAPPLVTAVTTALGTRALRGDPAETLDVMVAVLRAAAWSGVAPMVLALTLAAVLTLTTAHVRRSAPPD